MTITKQQRGLILGVLLVATLAVTAVSSNEAVDDGVVRPLVKTADIVVASVPASDNKAVKLAVSRLDFGRLNRNAEEIVAIDVFAPKSWAPPPPKVVPVVAQPVVPVAPPLPFRYVGQLGSGDGKVTIYLARGDTVHTVRVGDVLEEQYRLDALDSGQITLTYLPMNQQQMLAIPPR